MWPFVEILRPLVWCLCSTTKVTLLTLTWPFPMTRTRWERSWRMSWCREARQWPSPMTTSMCPCVCLSVCRSYLFIQREPELCWNDTVSVVCLFVSTFDTSMCPCVSVCVSVCLSVTVIRSFSMNPSCACLKRTCSLDTSAFSATEVLDDNRAL